MSTYALGLDYGTESARSLLADTATGEEAGSVVFLYPHGIKENDVDGVPLKHGSALQHPGDYLEFLRTAIPELLRQTGVAPE
jgi:L-ribulokinase